MKKKYQLKDSTVEAVFYDGSNYDEIVHFTEGKASRPFFAERGVRCSTLDTQFGDCRVYPNNYIVHIRGRLYMSVAPDIFISRYDEVKAGE